MKSKPEKRSVCLNSNHGYLDVCMSVLMCFEILDHMIIHVKKKTQTNK